VSNVESKLEIALAGFKKGEVYVYTQDGKLFVEGQKEDKETDTKYVHKGLAQRSFTRAWTLSDETEVRSVEFEDGLLTVTLGKIVPDHHKRKDYL
jgi:molecular chaperone IbpA